jgi:hypothetical protein
MAFEFDIPTQRFEIIRDQVALIIFDELQNQLVRRPLETEFGAGVWVERGITFDRAELPAVKVYFAKSNYDQDGRVSSQGACQINIEVTAKGRSSLTTEADEVAAKVCQKLLGAIRYILKHPTYNRLAFTGRPYIKGITVTDIRMAEPTEQGDGFRSVAGQLILGVRYEEDNGDLTSETQLGSFTSIKISDTDKGYKLEKIV